MKLAPLCHVRGSSVMVEVSDSNSARQSGAASALPPIRLARALAPLVDLDNVLGEQERNHLMLLMRTIANDSSSCSERGG